MTAAAAASTCCAVVFAAIGRTRLSWFESIIVSDAFVVPMTAPLAAPSAFAAKNDVGGTPTMVATPDRVAASASSSAFEPTEGPNAPLRVNNNGEVWLGRGGRDSWGFEGKVDETETGRVLFLAVGGGEWVHSAQDSLGV